eukprot:Hpha_TRINITY_DN20103_c0_g1::TRINITY_DN20103_c0_g1_i1::g.82578::m.82578
MPPGLLLGSMLLGGLVVICQGQTLDTTGLDKIVDDHKLPSLAVGIFVGGNNASCPAVHLAAVSHGTQPGDRPASALGSTPSSPYLWASVSKTFTHAALTILVDRGDAGLDDDISTAIGFEVRNPNFPDVPVLVRYFFNHSTSLIDPTGAALDATYTYGDDCSPTKPLADWFTDYVAETGSWGDWSPGSQSKYSNMGTGLEGLFVEKVSKVSFSDFCQQNIFTPLGMQNTSWLLSGLSADGKKGAVTLFGFDQGALQEEQNYCFPDWPSGSLRSSPEDVLLFLATVANLGEYPGGRLWSEETGVQVVSPFPGANAEYGHGWSITPLANGGYQAGHEGQETGASTSVDITPRSEQSPVAQGSLYATNVDVSDAFRKDVAAWLQLRLAVALPACSV